MPSMNYCMYQNTVLEMKQILAQCENQEPCGDCDACTEGSVGPCENIADELSIEEARAKERLIEQCAQFLELNGYTVEEPE